MRGSGPSPEKHRQSRAQGPGHRRHIPAPGRSRAALRGRRGQYIAPAQFSKTRGRIRGAEKAPGSPERAAGTTRRSFPECPPASGEWRPPHAQKNNPVGEAQKQVPAGRGLDRLQKPVHQNLPLRREAVLPQVMGEGKGVEQQQHVFGL